MRAVPLSGVRKPVTIFAVVVLPAPLGPRKPRTSPWPTSQGKARHRSDAAKTLGQVFDFEHSRPAKIWRRFV